MSAVDRTIIVLDCRESIGLFCAKDYEAKVNIKDKTTDLKIKRTVLSACVSAIIEYSRILFDLYPTDCQVRTSLKFKLIFVSYVS
jgi:hypothetical protein